MKPTELALATFAALAARAFGAFLSLLITIKIASLWPKGDAGDAFSLMAYVYIAATISRLGLDQVLLRNCAVGYEKSICQYALVRQAFRLVFLVSMGMAMLVLLLSPGLPFSTIDVLSYLPAIPAMTIFILASYILRGLDLTVRSIFVQTACQPIVLLIALVTIEHLEIPPASVSIGWLYSISCVIASVISVYWCARTFAKLSRLCLNQQATPQYSEFVRDAFPLMVVAITQALTQWGPVVFLSSMGRSEEVADFHACARFALISQFLLFAITTVVSPVMARCYESKSLRALYRLYITTCVIGAIAGGIPLILLWLFAAEALGLFGSEYMNASGILKIVIVGQFVNVCTGAISTLLVMSKYQNDVRNCAIFSAILLLVCCFCMIPYFGAYGAAIATAVSVASQNIFAIIAFIYRFREWKSKLSEYDNISTTLPNVGG